MGKDSGQCELCGRRRTLTFHHFIPRALHRNKWFKKVYTRRQMVEGLDICRDCHAAIHKLIPDRKDLARNYNTKSRLLAHVELGKFIAWIAGRDTGRVRTLATNPTRAANTHNPARKR